MICELRGFGVNVLGKPIRCIPALDGHHLINRAKFKRGSKVDKYIQKHPEIFFSDVCGVHNRDKWADTPVARRILLKRKVDTWGIEYVKSVINGMPWKVVPHELTYDGIMSAPLPK